MLTERIITVNDTLPALRKKYPQGLHFVVGDTHGEAKTLRNLMRRIAFNPDHDHVYFVGDYNSGGTVRALLSYLSQYYVSDK